MIPNHNPESHSSQTIPGGEDQRILKRVVIFRRDLLPASETFIREQARALFGWTPILTGYQRLLGGLNLDGVETHILPGLGPGLLGRLWLRAHHWLGRAHRPTVQALKALRPDLVHAHFGTDATDIWPSVKAAGLPLLVTLHGYDINTYREWWESGAGGLLRRPYPRRLLKMAKDRSVRFIAVSKAIKRRAIEFGIPEERITVCYIGLDTNRFKPAGAPIERRGNRILFVGRMIEKKAPLLMIRTYAEVKKKVPDSELIMIGDGILLNEAKALATELRVPVRFLGECTPDEVLIQLHQAAILCLPSVTAQCGDAEGFGMVLLEAQACGVPVVSSALGGAAEAILPGKTGYAADPGDTAALAHYAAVLLDDRQKRRGMSLAASAYIADNFDIFELSKKLSHIYGATARFDP